MNTRATHGTQRTIVALTVGALLTGGLLIGYASTGDAHAAAASSTVPDGCAADSADRQVMVRHGAWHFVDKMQ